MSELERSTVVLQALDTLRLVIVPMTMLCFIWRSLLSKCILYFPNASASLQNSIVKWFQLCFGNPSKHYETRCANHEREIKGGREAKSRGSTVVGRLAKRGLQNRYCGDIGFSELYSIS